ncbi:zinc-binding dehydrogenase [uncultured Propionibacterium sp.]|uniref:zinc-binding dehydrogenase n=1 Tax=uncultured Propionibacterium sp. TaxID=218066 RepID=UPI0029314599|nr:zinc-binding dehydrogenase [uncultured Propionibacterium sp.]
MPEPDDGIVPAGSPGAGGVPATMRAVVLDGPGPATNLRVRELPVPVPAPGWVRIRVRAFGLNHSELMTRLGMSGDAVAFPRVLGIEAVGEVDLDTTGALSPGTRVAAMMGGMGREYDGGYAQYTCVPAGQVSAFDSDLDWGTIGAVPEMLQTAYGSLTTGCDGRPGQSLLVRGGTTSVGMALAVLAKQRGMTVLATTRRPAGADRLAAVGVDHVVIDDGDVAGRVRRLVPGGVDCAVELIGATTLRDTVRALRRGGPGRPGGVCCFTGMVSHEWSVPDFYPIDFLPNGVRLTAYSGEAADLPAEVLQRFLDDAAAGRVGVPVGRVMSLDEVPEAHQMLEDGTGGGKIVIITG